MALINFQYVTQKKKGSAYKKATIMAESAQAAEKKLLETEIPVLALERAEKQKFKPLNKKSVPMKEILLFAQQMEATQKIQMSRIGAIDLCIETAQTKDFKLILEDMRRSIADGGTLYDAMRRFPNAFDDLTLGLVNAGEQAGALDRSFSQIKFVMKRSIGIKKKIVGLMIYPAIVFSIALGCIFLLCWKTVPAFAGLFKEAKMDLPLPTKILVMTSDTTINHPLMVLGVIFAMIFFVFNIPKLIRKFPVTHKWVLRTPVVGNIQRKLIQATFARTLSQMIAAQMPLLTALVLCRTVSNNYEYRAAIGRGTIKVSKGNSMMSSFEPEKDILSVLLVRVLGFGETTGKTEDVLQPLAESLDEAANEYIDNMKQAIEPLLTLLIGGVVLLIMLGLFIPIFSLPKLV